MLFADSSVTTSMSLRQAHLLLVLSIACLICLVAFFTPRSNFGFTLQKHRLDNLDKLLTLDFVPRASSRFTDCGHLFVGTPLDHYNMSSLYWSLYHKFLSAIPQRRHFEGHSGRYLQQTKVLHYLAARPSNSPHL